MKKAFSLIETIIALLVVSIFVITSMFVINRIKEISSENQHAVRLFAAKSAIFDYYMYWSSTDEITPETVTEWLQSDLGFDEFEVENIVTTNPGNDENISLIKVTLKDTLTGRGEDFYVVSYNKP